MHWRLSTSVAAVRDFYSKPVAWFGLLVCGIGLAYGGGAVLFWFHSVYLGEGGPAISPWMHWLVDSSAGFLGLTPVIALMLPLAVWVATSPSHSARAGRRPEHAARQHRTTALARGALLGGGLLALTTAPAPLLHDALIGRGTWLAARITELLGGDYQPTGHPRHASVLVRMAEQVTVAVPTYAVFTALGLLALRRAMGGRFLRVGGPGLQSAT
jgi:hypothetical protein